MSGDSRPFLSELEEIVGENTVQLYLGGLPLECEETLLCKYFAQFGSVNEICLNRNKNGKLNCCGNITITCHSPHIANTITSRSHTVLGKQIEVKLYVQSEDERKRQQDEDNSRAVHVKGLREEETDEELCKYFEQYGPIERAYIVRKNDKSKGFGFVRYSQKESAEKVLGMKHFLNGVEIFVAPKFCKNEKKKDNTDSLTGSKKAKVHSTNLSEAMNAQEIPSVESVPKKAATKEATSQPVVQPKRQQKRQPNPQLPYQKKFNQQRGELHTHSLRSQKQQIQQEEFEEPYQFHSQHYQDPRNYQDNYYPYDMPYQHQPSFDQQRPPMRGPNYSPGYPAYSPGPYRQPPPPHYQEQYPPQQMMNYEYEQYPMQHSPQMHPSAYSRQQQQQQPFYPPQYLSQAAPPQMQARRTDNPFDHYIQPSCNQPYYQRHIEDHEYLQQQHQATRQVHKHQLLQGQPVQPIHMQQRYPLINQIESYGGQRVPQQVEMKNQTQQIQQQQEQRTTTALPRPTQQKHRLQLPKKDVQPVLATPPVQQLTQLKPILLLAQESPLSIVITPSLTIECTEERAKKVVVQPEPAPDKLKKEELSTNSSLTIKAATDVSEKPKKSVFEGAKGFCGPTAFMMDHCNPVATAATSRVVNGVKPSGMMGMSMMGMGMGMGMMGMRMGMGMSMGMGMMAKNSASTTALQPQTTQAPTPAPVSTPPVLVQPAIATREREKERQLPEPGTRNQTQEVPSSTQIRLDSERTAPRPLFDPSLKDLSVFIVPEPERRDLVNDLDESSPIVTRRSEPTPAARRDVPAASQGIDDSTAQPVLQMK
jgi:RNA recognition motif-containing protein